MGSPAFALTLAGSNFLSGSTVLWNGTALTTTYGSSTSLSAQVPAANLASAGTAQVSVQNPAGEGGTSAALTFTITAPNPAPTLTSINPPSAVVGSPGLALTLTGSGFLAASVAQWNGTALPTTFVSSTTLTAQVPAADLATSGVYTVMVNTPAPGGGTSPAQSFTVLAAGNGTPLVINATANSLAWDGVNQKLYVSRPSTAGALGNSVQALDPVTGDLGAPGYAGSEPDLLSVSANGKYVYVGLDGSSAVQRLALPGLTQDINIPLGSGQYDGPYIAGDLQAAPNADGTVAVVRDVNGTSPAEEGGVLIYDDGNARPNPLCGFIQIGCRPPAADPFGGLYDSIQWNADASMLFAMNTEDTGFDFYTVPVSAAGFGTVVDYSGVGDGFGGSIHFDATTGYVYEDYGRVINPANGSIVGTFDASGIAAPDGKLGVIFFLGQSQDSYGSSTFTLESFDIHRFTPINTMTISNVTGTPIRLVRWGTNGLAFNTLPSFGSTSQTGQIYILSGSFVDGGSSGTNPSVVRPEQNVHRSWKAMSPAAIQAAADKH